MDSAWSKGEIWSGEPTRTRAVSRLPQLAKTRLGFSGSETPVKVQGSKGYGPAPGLISSYVASGFTTGSPDKTTGFLGSERGLIEALVRRGLLPEVSSKPSASTLSFGLVLLE